MGNPVVHFELASKDAERDKKFYSDLFGWQIETRESPCYGVINTGDGGIGGGIFGIEDEQCCAPYVTIYVAVYCLKTALERVVELGCEVVVQPQSIPGGSFAMFLDPDKNLIGLWETAK